MASALHRQSSGPLRKDGKIMEKILLNNEAQDDFIIKSIATRPITDEELNDIATTFMTVDGEYVPAASNKLKNTTEIVAMRPDGAILITSICHGDMGIINSHIAGAVAVGEMRIGFYLRKEENPTEKKIIAAQNKIILVQEFNNRNKQN